MAATQYVGAKYVPHGWEEWNQDTYYDGLFCVSYNYSWFIAKQNVPAGISPVNTEYWAPYSLTTGAQQELVELVNKYNPERPLENNTNLNNVLEPGVYYLDGSLNYINNPTQGTYCTLEVRKISVTSVIQIIFTGGSNGTIWTRQCSSELSQIRDWQLVADKRVVSEYTENNLNKWVDNVDVFEYVKNENRTRVYFFGVECQNMPTYSPYFIMEQRHGILLAWGGSGTGSTVAVSYFDTVINTWKPWSIMPNSRYMNNLGFNHMTIRPIQSGDGPYKYTFYLKQGDHNVLRTTILLLMNGGNGSGAVYIIYVRTDNTIISNIINKESVFPNVTFSNDNNKNLVIETDDQYLNIIGISVNDAYGAISYNSPTFNSRYSPWLNPIDEPMNIPELGLE